MRDEGGAPKRRTVNMDHWAWVGREGYHIREVNRHLLNCSTSGIRLLQSEELSELQYIWMVLTIQALQSEVWSGAVVFGARGGGQGGTYAIKVGGHMYISPHVRSLPCFALLVVFGVACVWHSIDMHCGRWHACVLLCQLQLP